MGLLSKKERGASQVVVPFHTKKEKLSNLPICIPDHQKEKLEQREFEGEQDTSFSGTPAFRITGIYSLSAGYYMLSGKVTSGAIKAGLGVTIGEKEVTVTEVSKGLTRKKVDMLRVGDSGSIYVRTNLYNLKVGDSLRFG